MILPPHKNALLSGEGGESGCWQEKASPPSFWHMVAKWFSSRSHPSSMGCSPLRQNPSLAQGWHIWEEAFWGGNGCS